MTPRFTHSNLGSGSSGAADPAQVRQEHPQGSTDFPRGGIKPTGFAF